MPYLARVSTQELIFSEMVQIHYLLSFSLRANPARVGSIFLDLTFSNSQTNQTPVYHSLSLVRAGSL